MNGSHSGTIFTSMVQKQRKGATGHSQRHSDDFARFVCLRTYHLAPSVIAVAVLRLVALELRLELRVF